MNKKKCPNCHKVCGIRHAFCPHCGYKLEESDVLYHYTSIETLNAILSNIKHEVPDRANKDSLDFYKFVLRATHWQFFNDPLEYQFYYQNLLEFFDNDPKLRKLKEKFEYVVGITGGFSGMPYIISLSKCFDNLDMWRSYSKNGTGVAIGFKADVLKELVTRLNIEQKFNTVRLYDCRYLEDEQIYSEIRKINKKPLLEALSMDKIPLNGFSSLFETFATFKHPCYMSEREKRIVTFYHNMRQSNVKFRVSNGTNIPYLEVGLPLSLIKEIVIGPCANKELNEDSIRMQLDYITGLTKDIQIKFSELPYRQV